MTTADYLVQFGIACTGLIAVWLSQSGSPAQRKYACLFGLCGQPLWFYASISAGQWGIFILNIAYTISWMRGFRTYWLKELGR